MANLLLYIRLFFWKCLCFSFVLLCFVIATVFLLGHISQFMLHIFDWLRYTTKTRNLCNNFATSKNNSKKAMFLFLFLFFDFYIVFQRIPHYVKFFLYRNRHLKRWQLKKNFVYFFLFWFFNLYIQFVMSLFENWRKRNFWL